MIRKLEDYDIWYQPCDMCKYDAGKSTKPSDGVKRCWRCGMRLKRDFSDRALKKGG